MHLNVVVLKLFYTLVVDGGPERQTLDLTADCIEAYVPSEQSRSSKCEASLPPGSDDVILNLRSAPVPPTTRCATVYDPIGLDHRPAS